MQNLRTTKDPHDSTPSSAIEVSYRYKITVSGFPSIAHFPIFYPMTDTLTPQLFGETPHHIPASQEYLTLNFSPASGPRQQRWSNYGLSADFLGDYFAAFFPGDALPDSKINRRDSVKATVSFIANELLENAVKYNASDVNHPITISLHLYDTRIIFNAVNHATQAVVERYRTFIHQVTDAQVDLDDVYAQQLEKTAMGHGDSCMGLLTMMCDYSARFGWQFEPLASAPEIVRVSVLVHLDV